MLKSNFFINPKRIKGNFNLKNRIKRYLQMPFLLFLNWLGYTNINFSYVHGDKKRVNVGTNCSTMNTIFNAISGKILIGDHTIFGHNCMVLTGTHNFIDGKLAGLNGFPDQETPKEGRDIVIGEGCFIGSGTILIGPLTIGDNVLIASGSVVFKDVPSSCFVSGSPAQIKKIFDK